MPTSTQYAPCQTGHVTHPKAVEQSRVLTWDSCICRLCRNYQKQDVSFIGWRKECTPSSKFIVAQWSSDTQVSTSFASKQAIQVLLPSSSETLPEGPQLLYKDTSGQCTVTLTPTHLDVKRFVDPSMNLQCPSTKFTMQGLKTIFRMLGSSSQITVYICGELSQ